MNFTFEQWLKTRPENVQRVGKLYPVGTQIMRKGLPPLHLVSYAEQEDGGVLLELTEIDPSVDYRAAVAARSPMHWECLGLLDPLAEAPR